MRPDKYDEAVEYLTAHPEEIRLAWHRGAEWQRRIDAETSR